VGRYQKGKTNLGFTEARDSERQWHQLGHTQVCTSLQTDNHASTSPLSFFTGRMPFLPPNQQRQSACVVGWGLQTVSSHKNLRSNDLRRLYDANVLLDVRRTVDASRLSEGFRAKEPSVDPTRRVNMSVFLSGSLHCELARKSAKIQKEAQLSPRDRAMRRVS